jgi:hypothetical protein
VPSTTFVLTLNPAGNGIGSISSTAPIVTCHTPAQADDTCGPAVLASTPVTLMETTSSRDRFAGWSGACSGMGTTCTVTMDAAKTVTATFVAQVKISVTLVEPNFFCNLDCPLNGFSGADVVFDGGSQNDCRLTKNDDPYEGGTVTCDYIVDRTHGVNVDAGVNGGSGRAIFDHWEGACSVAIGFRCAVDYSSDNPQVTAVYSQ